MKLVTKSVRIRATLVFFLLVYGKIIAAQEHPKFQSGKWDVSVWVRTATGEENQNNFSEAQILAAGLFFGRIVTGEIGSGWRRGRLEYGFSVMPLFLQLRPSRSYGGGFEPLVLRWNSSIHTNSLRPYIELAGGAVRSNTNFPAGDTSMFNFTARGGGGIQLVDTTRRSLDVGCQWWHISNANLGVRNPEFNGIQLSFGYHWRR